MQIFICETCLAAGTILDRLLTIRTHSKAYDPSHGLQFGFNFLQPVLEYSSTRVIVATIMGIGALSIPTGLTPNIQLMYQFLSRFIVRKSNSIAF